MTFRLRPTELGETEIKAAIMHYMASQGWLPIPYKTQGTWDPNKKVFLKDHSPFFPIGASDIVIGKNNVIAWVEVKTAKEKTYVDKHYPEIENYVGKNEKKKHLKKQIDFHKKVKKIWGCHAFFAGSVKDVVAVLIPENLEMFR